MHKDATYAATAINNDYVEPDTFWFDPDWCVRHPDAPVAPASSATSPETEVVA